MKSASSTMSLFSLNSACQPPLTLCFSAIELSVSPLTTLYSPSPFLTFLPVGVVTVLLLPVDEPVEVLVDLVGAGVVRCVERVAACSSVERVAVLPDDGVVVVCADLEAQIAELDPEERTLFLEEMGLDRPGLDRLIQAAYRLLGLITYFTAGPKEARAWTIRRGTKAPGAAGVIHSDFERGFIRAETIKYADYDRLGTEAAVREAGLMRSEGRDYTVEDGDVMLFRFNV